MITDRLLLLLGCIAVIGFIAIATTTASSALAEFRRACDSVGGITVSDGKQHQCIRKDKTGDPT